MILVCIDSSHAMTGAYSSGIGSPKKTGRHRPAYSSDIRMMAARILSPTHSCATTRFVPFLQLLTIVSIICRVLVPRQYIKLCIYGAALVCTTSPSTTMSGIDSCLEIAKLTAAAGEMAPFPFIKGAAQCVVIVLEAIEVCLYTSLFSTLTRAAECRKE